MGFPDTAFDPHNNATIITIHNDPNSFIGALNNHSGNLLPIPASSAMNTKDVNVPFMTWVPPCYMHLFLGHHLAPCAVAVAGVTAVENNNTRAQSQAFLIDSWGSCTLETARPPHLGYCLLRT